MAPRVQQIAWISDVPVLTNPLLFVDFCISQPILPVGLFAGLSNYISVENALFPPLSSFGQSVIYFLPLSDSCVENDSLSLLDKTLDDQGDTASIRSRGSIHSVGSVDQQQKGVAMPRLEPFSPGQVFNHSHSCQVLVLPATDDHIMEVNAT